MKTYIGIGKLSFIPLTELAKEIPISDHHFLIQKDNYGIEIIDTETGLLAFDSKSVHKAIKNLAEMIVHYTVKNTISNGKEKFEQLLSSFDFKEYKDKYNELKTLYDMQQEQKRKETNFKLKKTYNLYSKYSIQKKRAPAA